jgi:serine/threonine protein kinase
MMQWTAVDSSRELVGVLGLPLEVAETLYGGSTDVHKYREPALDRYVVGKRVTVIDRPIVGELQEPRLQQRLQHDHLVPVITVSDIVDPSTNPPTRIDNEVEIVTPFYERGSIFDALNRGDGFDVLAVLNIARAAALGLAELHGEGYLHRDLKSPNIFLTDDGTVARVGDFGEAHPMDSQGRAPGIDSPTPWIAPEQVGQGLACAASDLFGLGVTLTEMLHGGFDLRGYDRVVAHRRMAQGHAPLPTRVMNPPPWAPPAVRTLVRQLTAARPELRRPGTAMEVADRLATAAAIGWNRVSDSPARWEGRARGDGRDYAVEIRELIRLRSWEVTLARRGSGGYRTLQRRRVDEPSSDVLQGVFDLAISSAH